MVTHDVEVLVVGMGPVGSVLALILAQRGIKVAVIEAAAQGATDLRASTFHAATVEMLDTIGAADVPLAQGLHASVYQYRDRQSGETFALDMSEIADVTRYPFRLQCEQHKMAAGVSAQLAGESTAEVRHRCRLLSLDQDDDGVTALVEGVNAVERYRAKIVVGADGGNSTVRKLLEIGFAGFTYDEKYLCLSTAEPLERAFDDLCYVNYISDAAEWLVLLRVPELWRVLLPVPAESDDDVLLSDENTQAVFRRILKDDIPVETRHRTIYRIHQRVCATFAQGRVALVGDAAHLNGPIGGFGMNSGIHDAFNLGGKLIQILRGAGDLDLIKLYDRQRRTVTNEVIQAETIYNMKAMRGGWATMRDGRRDTMRALVADQTVRRAFLLKQAMFTSLDLAAAIR